MDKARLPHEHIYIFAQLKEYGFTEIRDADFRCRVGAVVQVSSHAAGEKDSTFLIARHQLCSKAFGKEHGMEHVDPPDCFKILVLHEIDASSVPNNSRIWAEYCNVKVFEVVVFDQLPVLLHG